MRGNDLDAPALSRRSPTHVLLVLEQPVLVEVITLTLAHVRGDFLVASTSDAATVAAVLATRRPHLAVVDLALAQGEILAWLGYTARLQDERVPVVALTRCGDLRATLAAFAQGVDDVLTVPFAPEELLARILAVLRRTCRPAHTLQPVLHFGALKIDILNRHVRAGTAEVHLTSLEQRLLYLLAANAGRVLTRDEIMDQLWGDDFVAESNVVDRHVRNLRTKLRDSWRAPRYIATIPGRGYRFLPASEDERRHPASVPA